jgi:hypothetical protein
MKIPLTPCNLSAQFPTKIEKEKCFLHLLDDRVFYSMYFWADEPKNKEVPEEGLKEERTAIEILAFKKSVVGVEKTLAVSGKRWIVSIILWGFSIDIQMYFPKEPEATDVQQKLITWLTQKQ